MKSLTIVRGERQFLYDDVGNRYLDGIAGLWYTLIGHGRQRMASAIARQVATLEAFQTHGRFDNPPALKLADRLGSLFPIDDPLVFFSSGGGDAIETASKLAREFWRIQGYPRKAVLIARQNAYHGMHGFGSSLVGIESLRYGHEDGYPTMVVPTNDVDALELSLAELGPDRVAGFVAEPVVGAGGVILPADGYLAAARKVCEQNDVLFICDEVITGFGRMGTWSGAEFYGIQPDIITAAKGLTSGYVPLGAVLASRRVWGMFESKHEVFRHGYTYSGHPTACAAALENLAILEDEDLIQRVAELQLVFGENLLRLIEHPAFTEVRHVGLMAGVGLDHMGIGASLNSLGVDFGEEMVQRCIENGVILRRMFQGDLQVSPPLVIQEEDVQQIAEALIRSADSVLLQYGLQ
jgi:putrescine aminotransferase